MKVNSRGVKPARGRAGFGSVLTIDGATGSGKSLLLRGLAKRYGCEVIELGLVVRTIAWWATREQVTANDAVASLAELGREGKFALADSPDSPLAACDVFLFGQSRLVEILSPRLAPAIAATSLDPDAMAWVHAFVRALARDSVAAVSGRHAGSAACPDAGLKIRLEAEWPARKARKTFQRDKHGFGFAVVDDADLLAKAGSDRLRIDTTNIGPNQLLLRVSRLAERRLGWRPREISAPGHLLIGAA